MAVQAECIARMLAEGGWRPAAGTWRRAMHGLAAGSVAPHTLRARQRPPRRLPTYRVCVCVQVCTLTSTYAWLSVCLSAARPKRPCQATAHVRMLMTLMISMPPPPIHR